MPNTCHQKPTTVPLYGAWRRKCKRRRWIGSPKRGLRSSGAAMLAGSGSSTAVESAGIHQRCKQHRHLACAVRTQAGSLCYGQYRATTRMNPEGGAKRMVSRAGSNCACGCPSTLTLRSGFPSGWRRRRNDRRRGPTLGRLDRGLDIAVRHVRPDPVADRPKTRRRLTHGERHAVLEPACRSPAAPATTRRPAPSPA